MKFRVELSTNAAARAAGTARKLGAWRASHNGGKIVIVTCHDLNEANAFRAWAEDANAVRSFEALS